MSVKLVGTQSKPARIQTGLHSLDLAFINSSGDTGLPVGVGYEIFGLNATGKSTFAYSLSAVIGREVGGDVALADFEGFDPEFVTRVMDANGLEGKLYIVSEETDEDQLDSLVAHLTKKCAVGILDSIGAIAPMGETKGDIGEANMGKRAFLMAQFSRKMLKLFRFQKEHPRTVLMINHWYPKLGGYGYDTPGGEAKKYLASVRIKLKREETFPDGSYALEGLVVKNRWGMQDRTFHVLMLAGLGLSADMTAVWDCIKRKLVKRGKTGITCEGENLGKLGLLARAAREGKHEVFEPFYTLLRNAAEAPADATDGSDDPGADASSEEMGNLDLADAGDV